jgi:hypothetical protein
MGSETNQKSANRHRGLGQAAPNPLFRVLKYFPDELTEPLGHW